MDSEIVMLLNQLKISFNNEIDKIITKIKVSSYNRDSSTEITDNHDIKNAVLNYRPVEYDQIQEINLCYIFSTRDFFVHLNNGQVESFYFELNRFYKEELLKNDIEFKPNSLINKEFYCVYNDTDSSYYRGQILQKSDEKYLVRLVDFGDLIFLNINSIFKLVQKFANEPIFAIHCYLEGSFTSDCSKKEAVFLKLIDKPNQLCNKIKAIFKKSETPCKVATNLILKDIDNLSKNFWNCNFESIVDMNSYFPTITFEFKEFFNENLKSSHFELSKKIFGNFFRDYKNVYKMESHVKSTCIYVENILGFFVSKITSTQLVINMSNFYNGFLECDRPKTLDINTLVVFTLDDKLFFRGIYLERVSSEEYGLLSIDFGFSISVSIDNLYPLVPEFSLDNIPAMGAFCSIYNVIGPIKNSIFFKNVFYNLLQKDFTVHVENCSKDICLVEIETSNIRLSELVNKFIVIRNAS